MLKLKFIVGLLLISTLGMSQDISQSELNLIPVPTDITVHDDNYYLNKEFKISVQGKPHSRMYPATNRFLDRLRNRTGLFISEGILAQTGRSSKANLSINVERPAEVRFGENESYVLQVSNAGVALTAPTDMGVLRGLETLLQLISADEKGYYFKGVKIEDSPRFPWRGLMIDVARHFQPVEVIKRNIDGLAAVKMNVLHLHLSDDQGFRVESKTFPELTLKGSDGFFYTQEQIKDIVDYADQRGVRVYPEFDVPGHATAILTAYPELASKKDTYSIERNAGIFDPTLDPTNPKTYEFLNELFTEMASLFKDEYFHIGGDENEGRHWDENEDIQQFMNQNKIEDNHALQGYFNMKILNHLEKLGKKMIGWDEIIHEKLPKSAVIQSWRGLDNMQIAAQNGYKTMLSNGFYIDLMHAAYKHYLVEPLPDSLDLTQKEKENIIGGEATMWSELVTPHTIDSRIWPRTAAIAERLWSPKNIRSVDDMYRRLSAISIQLEQLGLKHLSSRDVILRNLAQQQSIEPIKVLAKVCQPLQGYTRNPKGTMYQSYSPFMLFADACVADPPDAHHFNKLVDRYLTGDNERLYEIKKYLSVWSSNHQLFKELAKKNPSLNDISQLSANLSELSRFGQEALQFVLSKKQPNGDWIKRSQGLLSKAREQGGRTELKVVDSIERLIKSTFNQN